MFHSAGGSTSAVIRATGGNSSARSAAAICRIRASLSSSGSAVGNASGVRYARSVSWRERISVIETSGAITCADSAASRASGVITASERSALTSSSRSEPDEPCEIRKVSDCHWKKSRMPTSRCSGTRTARCVRTHPRPAAGG